MLGGVALLVDNPTHIDPAEAGKTAGQPAPKRKLHAVHESEHPGLLGNIGSRFTPRLDGRFAS